MATRKSTPKYYVFHIGAGLIVLSGVSKTEATNFARSMDEGRKGKKRFAVAPVARPKVGRSDAGARVMATPALIKALELCVALRRVARIDGADERHHQRTRHRESGGRLT